MCVEKLTTFQQPVRSAQEFYLHAHKCWSEITETLAPLITEAFRVFTGVSPSGTCTLPLTPGKLILLMSDVQ